MTPVDKKTRREETRSAPPRVIPPEQLTSKKAGSDNKQGNAKEG